MKLRLTEDQARAVVRLGREPDFKLFLESIYKLTEHLNENLVRRRFPNTEELFEVRGAVAVLVEVAESLRNAPELLEKIEKREG